MVYKYSDWKKCGYLILPCSSTKNTILDTPQKNPQLQIIFSQKWFEPRLKLWKVELCTLTKPQVFLRNEPAFQNQCYQFFLSEYRYLLAIVNGFEWNELVANIGNICILFLWLLAFWYNWQLARKMYVESKKCQQNPISMRVFLRQKSCDVTEALKWKNNNALRKLITWFL